MVRPTAAFINLAAIRHNLQAIRNTIAPDVGIIAVVKANAYGHGSVQVSKTALQAGASALAVAIPEEGQQLRQAGITAPIMVLGLSLPEAAPYYVKSNLIATVSTPEGVTALIQAARRLGRRAAVTVKVDTGMNRIGLLPVQALSFIQWIREQPELDVYCVMTHLACADEADKTAANQQLQRFSTLQTIAPGSLLSAANSAGIIDLTHSHLSAVRPGIIMYGLPPSRELSRNLNLRPAMQLKTRIVLIKKVAKHSPISYGATYTTTDDVYVATLPIGYADGYSRHLSNKAFVLINGKRRRLIGRVCMDQCLVELGPVCDAAIGDEVVLFGRQGHEEITVTELAALAGTINYDLLCAVSPRIPRVYIDEQ